MIDPEFLAVLACPRCDTRPPLEVVEDLLVCTECRYRYKVVDGIPYLLVEEAIAPDEETRP